MSAYTRYNLNMQRITETELMAEPTQAKAYAEANFESAHQYFIDLFQNKFPQLDISNEVLDLGCGPGDITRRFASAYPAAILHAVDGATAMLREAMRLNTQNGLANRIELINTCLPNPTLPQQHYHTLISNSLLHHLHDPSTLWKTLKQHSKPLAKVFVMDFMRPDNKKKAKMLVEQYAANEPDILRKDFYHSLCAAFTPTEIQIQLDECSLAQLTVEIVSDRHMIIYGIL